MNIENQAIVSTHGAGSQVLADITILEGQESLKLTIQGTSKLTPIEALSLISVFQESLKNAWEQRVTKKN